MKDHSRDYELVLLIRDKKEIYFKKICENQKNDVFLHSDF